MMNAPYALRTLEAATPVQMRDSDFEKADLAGTRMLIAEESFDAIVQLLIDAGLVSKDCVAVTLDRLSAKLMMHASGLTETQWGIRAPELLDQARRLATIATVMRAGRRG